MVNILPEATVACPDLLATCDRTVRDRQHTQSQIPRQRRLRNDGLHPGRVRNRVPRHSPTVVVWHLNDDQSVLPVAARSSPLEVVAVAEDQKLDGATILSVFRQGACAIVSLTDNLRGLPEACYRASIRRSYLSGSLLDPLLSHLSRPSFNRTAREFGLTSREYEVLTHLAHGLTHREIAATLRTTERTVRHHLEQIYRKLRVQNRLQAVIHAYRQGLAF